jgi:hypothetical protein
MFRLDPWVSRLREVGAWWVQELLDLMPPGLRAALAPQSPRVVLRGSPDGITASLLPGAAGFAKASWSTPAESWDSPESSSRIKAVARWHLVDFEVPANLILTKEIVLPRVAAEDLATSVTYGLPNWSPFTAEEVHLSARAVRSDESQVTVELRYVVRKHVARWLESAGAAGLTVDRVIFGPDGRHAAASNSGKLSRITLWRRIDRTLTALVVILLIALVASCVWRQSRRMDQLEGAVRAEIEGVKRDDALQKSLDALASRRTIVARRRAVEAPVFEVMAAIGARLPPKAAIRTFETGGGRGWVEIDGVTPAEIAAMLGGITQIREFSIEPAGPGRSAGASFGIRRTP